MNKEDLMNLKRGDVLSYFNTPDEYKLFIVGGYNDGIFRGSSIEPIGVNVIPLEEVMRKNPEIARWGNSSTDILKYGDLIRFDNSMTPMKVYMAIEKFDKGMLSGKLGSPTGIEAIMIDDLVLSEPEKAEWATITPIAAKYKLL